MRIRAYFEFVIFLFLAISCQHAYTYIIETDINKLAPDRKNGETIIQSNEKARKFFDEVTNNTVGKMIPHLKITDTLGNKKDLQDVLSGKTIIISSDLYCGFGEEGLLNDFPKAMKRIGAEKNHLRIICLIKKQQDDEENPKRLINTLKELNRYYTDIYIINELESRKINLFANPTRLYINKDKVVTHIALGISTIELLESELRENLN